MNAAAQSKFTSVVCGFTIELGMAIEQIELAGAKPVRLGRSGGGSPYGDLSLSLLSM